MKLHILTLKRGGETTRLQLGCFDQLPAVTFVNLLCMGFTLSYKVVKKPLNRPNAEVARAMEYLQQADPRVE